MAKVIGVRLAKSADQTIYDPTCGSGSLLLKAHDEAPFDLTIYGQEMDNATRAMAKMTKPSARASRSAARPTRHARAYGSRRRSPQRAADQHLLRIAAPQRAGTA